MRHLRPGHSARLPRPRAIPRLAAPYGPIPSSVATCALWWLIAHNSGDGWFQALGDLVFAALLVGTAGPALATARARPRVVSAPPDGQVGRTAELVVECPSRVRVTPLYPPGAATMIGPGRAGARTRVPVDPDRRGEYPAILVEVASAAPFGLQWWRRVVSLDLPQTFVVAPRPGVPAPLPSANPARSGTLGAPRPGADGELRSVRTYRPGDHRRLVHWPASAHSGELMVRELEAASGPPVELRVVLPSDSDGAEALAGSAFASAAALLGAGRPVILVTDEVGGPVRDAVLDRRQAGRRLARATAAAPTARGSITVSETGQP